MTDSSRPIRLALAGCGGIAQTHLEAIARVGRVKLEVIQDINPTAGEQAAAKYACRFTKNPDELFKDRNLDAVLVCTPPATHFEFVKKIVEAGKHVLCEKPFTTSLKDAEAIKKLSAKSGKLVMMASKFRFVSDVIEAKKFVESGVLGDIVLSEVIFCSVVNMERRWNADPGISGGGVLIDNGSHAVDVIRYLVGPIKSVYAQAGKRTQNIAVEDTARLHFETETNIIGMVDLSWSLYKHTANYVNLFGTRGTAEVGWSQSSIWDAGEKSSRVFGNGYKKLDAFVRQMEHFADCIQGKTAPILGIDDALESVRVIEAAYTSIREKKWLKVHP
ncbi:MAG: Gfo/Idh/MocA family oxidoreductase [Candidatus Omnitrophica bacterium]|nr:Gfo/Idh/MocA family oxidoreductase [Candidatus Omnitrophota bacterium]